MSDKRIVWKTQNSSILDKIAENRLYSAYKYRFGLQKGIKIQRFFFILEKYDVSTF